MRRTRVIAIAIMLGVLGAALPIAGALYVSWSLALHAEQKRLSEFAGRVITRADKSLAEISDALVTISRSTEPSCSAGHIAEMRRLSFNTPSIQEIVRPWRNSDCASIAVDDPSRTRPAGPSIL